MKVKELRELLAQADSEAEVVIHIDGSIFSSSTKEELEDYNEGNDTNEFFLLGSLDAP